MPTAKEKKKLDRLTKKLTNEDLEDMSLDREENQPVTKHNTLDGRGESVREAVAYRRRKVLRLMMRGIPKEMIIKHLDISIHTLNKDIEYNNNDVRTSVQNIDLPLTVGLAVNFYDEVRNLSMRLATLKNESTTAIQKSLTLALNAENDKQKYLAMCGLYGDKNKEKEIFNEHVLSNEVDDAGDITNFVQDFFNAVNQQKPALDKPSTID